MLGVLLPPSLERGASTYLPKVHAYLILSDTHLEANTREARGLGHWR